jgi:hypothetical protein
VVVPSPTWPQLLRPQHQACPLPSSAQLCTDPVLTWLKVTPTGCDTATGVKLGLRLPIPSCPLLLAPQQYSCPLPSSPQVWLLPVVSDTKVSPPDCCTATGVLRGVVVVPSPSWPLPFSPQQYACPPEVSPQECWYSV